MSDLTHYKKTIVALSRAFARNERGAMVVEYGVLIGVLSLVIVGGVGLALAAIGVLFDDTSTAVDTAL